MSEVDCNVSEVSLLQLSKERSPISVKLSGKVIEVSPSHCANASLLTVVKPVGNTTEISPQHTNALYPEPVGCGCSYRYMVMRRHDFPIVVGDKFMHMRR